MITIRILRWLTVAAAFSISLHTALSAEARHTSEAVAAQNTVSREEQLRKLTAEADDAQRAYLEASSQTRANKWQAYTAITATNIPIILRLVNRGPMSSSAFESLVWVVTNREVRPNVLLPYGFQAVELLLQNDCATNWGVSPVCWTLGRYGRWDPSHQPTITFLEEVVSRNPNRDARGQATFALANLAKLKAEAVGWYENAPEHLRNPEARKAAAEWAEKGDSDAFLNQAEQLFERVLRTYSDCSTDGKSNSKLGEMATSALYEIRHLWIGKVAPEIEGEDLDGRKLKLSDYRGKVVVLSFWGSWCGPCMAMVPFERELAERMAGKPFALVGVNSDEDRLGGKRAAEREKMTWRSFWSGTDGAHGSIPTAWNVQGWPTVYILDPKGTIRFKLVGFGGTNTETLLNRVVDRVMQESQNRLEY